MSLQDAIGFLLERQLHVPQKIVIILTQTRY